MSTEPKTLFPVYLLLILTVIIWGLSFVATKIALQTFAPFTLIFARFSVAAVLFFALMLRTGFPRFTLQDHLRMLVVALFEPGLYFIFETLGLQHTTAPKASLIIATIPAVVLVFAHILLKERITLQGILGIGASLAGIGVLVTGDNRFEWALGGQAVGDLLVFGAVLSASLYMIMVRGLGREYSALEITSMQTFYGAFLFLPGFLWEFNRLNGPAFNVQALAALAYLTLFATVAAFLCYNYALSKVPAYRAAVFINGIPVVTTLGALVFLDEKLTFVQGVGGMLVLLGVYVANRPRKRPRL